MRNISATLFSALLLIGGFGHECVFAAEAASEAVVQEDPIPFLGHPEKPKSIFVFLDGTGNVAADRTNVRRMFELISQNADPQKTGLYVSGVGTDSSVLTGNVLGRGMENRISQGLQFICNHFRPQDRVFVFGFSRGAHQARALAGILAYSGLPAPSGPDAQASRCSLAMINSIIETTKKAKEEDYTDFWNERWTADALPPLTEVLKKSLNIQVMTVPVAFLGIWDTVPGSSLKGYDDCRERKGVVKKYAGWILPGIDNSERYKVLPYSTISNIAHALSADEKRSKFRPLLVCKPGKVRPTQIVNEVWFPGAHSDVGGGYDDMAKVDRGGLPQLSLKWMVSELARAYTGFGERVPNIEGSAGGTAHWSLSSRIESTGSSCLDRKLDAGGIVDISVDSRKQMAQVPVIFGDKCVLLPYPVSCKDIGADKGWDGSKLRGADTKRCERPH